MDVVIPPLAEIDTLLTAALIGRHAAWPANWNGDNPSEAVLERIAYHGIGALLNRGDAALEHWPAAVRDSIREQALARSMWELRHALVIRALLDRMAAAGIPCLLLKGTAVAYDLYENPAERERGDTDLLVPKDKRDAARNLLMESGFRRAIEDQDLPETLRSQEPWSFTSQDGFEHSLDLHWQPLNAPALHHLLAFSEMATESRPLPRLSDTAMAPTRAVMLLHACLHRGMHDCAPYFVGERTYFGGNRLIWIYDIALLGGALSDREWRLFSRMATEKRLADVCLEGLDEAQNSLGAIPPSFVRDELARARSGGYFRSGQLGRALLDFWATPGARRKWEYLWARALPSTEFIRAKYPDMRGSPLPLLYLRRIAELVRARPKADHTP